MDSDILEFLEAYKSLDELCKQILSSDKGISEYIAEMEYENQGRMLVVRWEQDYKRLKEMRWIRNQLVHETNSFQENLISEEDIEWLKDFRDRIMKGTDPFSLLYQSRKDYQSKNTKRKTVNEENYSKDVFKTNEAFGNWYFVVGLIILVGIILVIANL